MGKPSDLPLILRLLFAGAAGPGLMIMQKGKFRGAPVLQARRSHADHRGDLDAGVLDRDR
jgi:hypothetical protein